MDSFRSASSLLSNKRPSSQITGFGFASAAAVLAATSGNEEVDLDDDSGLPAVLDFVAKRLACEDVHHEESTPTSTNKTDGMKTPIVEEIRFAVVGWPYYQDKFGPSKAMPPSRTNQVLFQRQPDNEHDSNAIAAFVISQNDTKLCLQIGHIQRVVAAQLAPLLDVGLLQFTAATIRDCHPSSFGIRALVKCRNTQVPALLQNLQSVVDPHNPASHNLSTACCKRSALAPYAMKSLPTLPWTPLTETDKHKSNNGSITIPLWLVPFDETKWDPLLPHEIEGVKSWPPPDEVLLRLCLAPSHDVNWYYTTAGLLPPGEWKVTGPYDLLPHVKLASQAQTQKARNALDGEIHGVTNVWHPTTLQEMRLAMHQSNFWCRRSPDALIRAFGGPYVLGQDSEKLKLVHGAPHTYLTRKMAVAHNIVYMLVHLIPPAEPGFNTLIFGCNLRGPGFHYHQDAIPGLVAKNAPLVPKQPVVTSIFYESSVQDSGKEVVLWKPNLNFSPVVDGTGSATNGSSCGNADYHAARALVTTHGMIHVQRAGLQSKSLHGIFHTPDTAQRQGYRVAITARITQPGASEFLRPFELKYCATWGPNGDCKLPNNSI